VSDLCVHRRGQFLEQRGEFNGVLCGHIHITLSLLRNLYHFLTTQKTRLIVTWLELSTASTEHTSSSVI